jgi:hypothetical protein
MAVKNLATSLIYKVLLLATQAGHTNDQGNHTLRLVGDGTARVPTNTPDAVDDAAVPGDYVLDLTAAERNYNVTCLAGKTSTAGALLLPVQVFSENLKGQEFTLCYFCVDTNLSQPKTGDAANHAMRLVQDGVMAIPDNSPAEVDATNCPGLYKLTVTAAESDVLSLLLDGESSTADVEIIPVQVFPYSLPDQPVISAAVDGGDEDSIDLTVTGSGTVQVYYRVLGTSAWSTGASRSGAGAVSQTGLDAGSWYEFYIVDSVGGIASAPSAIVSVLCLEVVNYIEKALRAKLIGDATIAALVSGRVFPDKIPERDTDGDPPVMPALVYQMIASNRDHTLDGPSGLVEGAFQIKCFDDNYSGAVDLADAVRLEIDGFEGTVAGVEIHGIFLDVEIDLPAVMVGAETLKRYCKVLDFRVNYLEAVG